MARGYGYTFGFVPVLAANVDTATLALGALGSGRFINNSSYLSNTARFIKFGTGSTLRLVQATKTGTLTTAALTSNVVTLTTSAAHGFVANDVLELRNCSNAAYNGKYIVASAPTTTTLTFALTSANISSASVTGTINGGTPIPLDGTASPIRLLGLTNAAPTEGENDESLTTYDDTEQAYQLSEVTSKTHSWALAGKVNHLDAGYQLMRFLSKDSASETLMIKYFRLGPVNVNEVTYGYGRFTGYVEDPQAGATIKFTQGIKAYGRYEIEFN